MTADERIWVNQWTNLGDHEQSWGTPRQSIVTIKDRDGRLVIEKDGESCIRDYFCWNWTFLHWPVHPLMRKKYHYTEAVKSYVKIVRNPSIPSTLSCRFKLGWGKETKWQTRYPIYFKNYCFLPVKLHQVQGLNCAIHYFYTRNHLVKKSRCAGITIIFDTYFNKKLVSPTERWGLLRRLGDSLSQGDYFSLDLQFFRHISRCFEI